MAKTLFGTRISLRAVANELENEFPVLCEPEDMYGGSNNGLRVQFLEYANESKQESLAKRIIKFLKNNHVYVVEYYFQAMAYGDLWEGVNTFAELRLMLVEYVE